MGGRARKPEELTRHFRPRRARERQEIYVQKLLEEVPEDIPVHRMSRTHVTTRTIKGGTTSHWLDQHKKGVLRTPCVVFVNELWLHEYNLLARLHAFSSWSLW